jgi:DNA-directed RNA polymerase subunit K/omega
LKTFGNVDSKFRFVILASMRAKQLLKGARPKIKGRSKNPIRIAQTELRMGLVDYEIIPAKREEAALTEEQVFLGDELRGEMDGGGGDISDKEDQGGYEESEEEAGEGSEESSEESEEESEQDAGEDKD